MISTLKVSRRSFIVGSAAAGGGLALGFNIPFGTKAAQAQAAAGTEVNAWVVIHPDDSVIIRVARSEMGQGTWTGLAQLVAEELGCDWSKVQAEYPTPGQNLARKRVWGDMSTGGSRGIRGSQDYVRQGGAAARLMLVQAAAELWNVPAAELTAANGVITHAASGRTTTYGKVAAAAAKLTPPDPKSIALKDPKTWTIAGQPKKRLDTADKLNGKQVYAIDVKLPGMLGAAIKDAPVFGARIKSIDEAKVAAMPGVRKIVRVGTSAVAVVADTFWQAKTALDALPIDYEDSPNAKVSSATIADFLKAGLDSTENVFAANKAGDAAAAIAAAPKKIEAVYGTPFLNHVTMEPMNCTAKWTAERCEVWVASQNGDASLAACAAAAGLPPEKCEVYKLHLGGGFGRRGFQDYVTQAVTIARQMPGVPIKLIWTREEDMTHGKYRPITQAKLVGALDDKGDLVGLHFRISGQSIFAQFRPEALQMGIDPGQFQGLFANADAPQGQLGYTIPNLLIDHAMRNTHVPVGFWRGVNTNQNAVYMECFMDELAHAAGKDPLEFRRALMTKHPRHLAVLDAVAAKAEWGKAVMPAGVFRGIAQMMGYGSYVAAVADVSVTNGKLKVHRIVMGTDCGHIVNPDQVDAQMVGSVAYGLSATLYEECTVQDGKIVEQNLDAYEILRLADFPKVETVMVPSGGFWGGVGEPTIMVVAPAVMNAIFAATGKRVRTLPLKNVKLG